MLLQVVGDRPLIEVSKHGLSNVKQFLVGVALDAADVRSKHLLLDLLDFEADFLTVRRVKHEALERVPGEEARGIPLVFWGSKGIHETNEHLTAINFDFLRLLDLLDLIENADRNLSEHFVNLFERL